MASSSAGVLPLAPAPLQTYPYPGLNVNDSQGPRIIGTSVTLIVISTLALVLRFVARHLSRAGLWWDDWTILAALILSHGAIICTLVGIPLGFGRHMGALGTLSQRIQTASQFFKLFYAYEIIYGLSIGLTKISILLFYSRIFKDRHFKLALYVTLGLVVVFTFAIEVAVLAQCQPAHALWDITYSPRRCIDLKTFFIGSGVPNIILNTIILVLPLPMVWALEIERKHKFALSGVFLLGGFIVIVSIIRVAVLSRIEQLDITWTLVDGAIWTTVEPAIAVVSACLPILRSLWIWNREKSEARRSNVQNSHVQSRKEAGKGSIRLAEKPHHVSEARRTPLGELPGDAEQAWVTKTEIKSDYTASTTRMQDSPAYMERAKISRSPDYSNYSKPQPHTARSYDPSRTGSESKSEDSSKNLTSALPIQQQEIPSTKKEPVQDLSGAYFPGKHEDGDSEPAELYGSAHVP